MKLTVATKWIKLELLCLKDSTTHTQAVENYTYQAKLADTKSGQLLENYTYKAKLADTKSGQLHMTSNTTHQGAFA